MQQNKFDLINSIKLLLSTEVYWRLSILHCTTVCEKKFKI